MNFMNPGGFNRMNMMQRLSPMMNQMRQPMIGQAPMRQPMMMNQMRQLPVGPSFNPMMGFGQQNNDMMRPMNPMPYGGINANTGMRPGDLSNTGGPIGAAYRQGRIQTAF